MLRVQLLGELEARIDGRVIEPPASRRAWSLLAWLALHPGEHPRGTLAARFWPDVLDASARASLRSAAWALRRALGPEGDAALVAGRDRLGLRCSTDLADFAALSAEGRLAEAVALSRGPLLADLDDDWVLEARDEHAAALGAALARLADAAPPGPEAVGFARRRLALDPLDEAAARDLMRHLAAAGDRAGALAVADRLADRLRTALGLAPSAETRAAAAELRDAVAEPAAPPAELAPALAGWAGPISDGAPFVGRDAELEELVRLWDRVRGGTGALALIGGEAGIGKSRLAAEITARARAAGALTARCTAVDLGVAPPFGLWVELLADLAADLAPPPADAHWPEELARLAPSLPRRLGRAPAPPADVPPDLARARLFEAVVELAEHATADRPLVLVLDDVHLADAATLELAAYLTRRIVALPVLLLMTRRMAPRRDEVDALAHAARGRGVAVCELDLAPLTREEVERLVGAIAQLAAPERERVIAAADGNPLLALESARAAARGEYDPAHPPSSLRGAVRAAVAGLPRPARRAAELAAVAGRDLTRSELSGLAEPEAVVAALDCGLLRSADGRFGFRHALLREAVYADIDDVHRAALHEELGAALAGHAAESARHLRLAGRDDLAAGRLVEAAAEATRATAFHEAAAFLREAVELDPTDPHARLELAATTATLGQFEPSETQLAAALELLDPGDPVGRATVMLRAARWYGSSLCHPPRAGSSAQQGLDALDARGLAEPALRAQLLLIRAWAEVTMAGAAAADRTLAEIAALEIDVDVDPDTRHDAQTVRGFLAVATGNLAEAEVQLAAAGQAGEACGRPDMAYGGWANAAVVVAAMGDFERALRHAQRGSATVRGLPALEFQMAALNAYILSRLGRHDEARAEMARQAELAARLGSPELEALALHDVGHLALQCGDYAAAADRLGRALEGAPRVERAEARLRRAEALARLDRPDEADAEIRAASLEPVHAAHRPAVLLARMTFSQALSARARGDVALAEQRLRESERHWARLADQAAASREYMSSLVDLGRPPLTGYVDPAQELERVAAELADLHAVPT
jgi:DNA-binding SARP family transcriptional activator/tetratricopeptide (TPR) repeat protein